MLLLAACGDPQSGLRVVANQHPHAGAAAANGDVCKTLYRDDGQAVVSPAGFKITPFDAVKIAKDTLGYSCRNKLGVQILADEKSYYIVRPGVVRDAIVVNGVDGSVKSAGFMRGHDAP